MTRGAAVNADNAARNDRRRIVGAGIALLHRTPDCKFVLRLPRLDCHQEEIANPRRGGVWSPSGMEGRGVAVAYSDAKPIRYRIRATPTEVNLIEHSSTAQDDGRTRSRRLLESLRLAHIEGFWGGFAFGVVLLFPVQLVVALLDMRIYGDSRLAAALAGTTQLALIGVGSGFFYGSSLRGWISELDWHQRGREALLAFLMPMIVLGPGFLAYAAIKLRRTEDPLTVAFLACASAGALSCVAIAALNKALASTDEDPHDAARNRLAGVLLLLFALAGDVLIRQWTALAALGDPWLP